MAGIKNNRNIYPLILAVFFPLAFMVLVYSSTGSLYQNHYDDAYITYRYAVNLAEHGELTFNLGERADAASSFLFTVILAVLYRLGIHNMEFISYFLNIIAVGAIGLFVTLSAIKMRVNPVYAVILGCIASCHGFISGWAALGMDTVFFAALLSAWTYWTFIERREMVAFVLTALLILTRFEGLLILPVWYFATGRQWKSAVILMAFTVLFYGMKFVYYGTLLSHALQAKHLLAYYRPNPKNIVNIWKHFAVAAPFLAAAGIILHRHLLWLGAYIAFSAVSCFIGPSSDWARYTVHLFPLMLIAGIPVLRRRYVALPLIVILLFQGFNSVQWMRYQAARLAPAQQIRGELGDWLATNAGSVWVLSGDLGEIAYRAIDCRFIDSFGLVSPDVLAGMRHKGKLDSIIGLKKPQYIADTFNYDEDKLRYKHADIPEFRTILGGRYSKDILFAIAEIP